MDGRVATSRTVTWNIARPVVATVASSARSHVHPMCISFGKMRSWTHITAWRTARFLLERRRPGSLAPVSHEAERMSVWRISSTPVDTVCGDSSGTWRCRRPLSTIRRRGRPSSRASACREFLARVIWPDGFRCPRCTGEGAWKIERGLLV
jgi:hypothetical protein